jgi:hypothetical protein
MREIRIRGREGEYEEGNRWEEKRDRWTRGG